MNPRFPTSARFRRHPPRHNLLPRLLLAGLVVGGGLFLVFRSKSPTPADTVDRPPQEQSAPRPSTPVPVTQAEVKPETRPEPKSETKSRPRAEAKLPLKPEVKQEAKPEVKQEAKPDLQAAPRPNSKPDLQSTVRPDTKPNMPPATQPEAKPVNKPDARQDVKPEVRPTGRQEIKLDIKPETRTEAKPETRPEPGPRKGEARTEAKAEAKAETGGEAKTKPGTASSPGPEARQGPLLPQPKASEEETGFHPLPDALPPKLREQEMDLTFYKGLAMKKMILPEEPPGKRVIPPFLAGTSPTSTIAKRPDGTPAMDKTASKTTSPKPANEPQKTAAEAKKSSSESQKAAIDPKKSTNEPQKPTGEAARKKSYQVQIAILSEMKNATALADSLRSQGAPNPRVSSIKHASGRTFFRVRLGPFTSQADAAKAGQRWQSTNQPAMISAMEE
ncbi:MAG: SPOR domain-containing protein [Magnetococcus sp. DMHC-8]